MASSASYPGSTTSRTLGARHRGLFLVPRFVSQDMSRGEASESSFSLDSLEQARRIVAQVEREVAEQAARERTLRMCPAQVERAPVSFWLRAVRAIGL